MTRQARRGKTQTLATTSKHNASVIWGQLCSERGRRQVTQFAWNIFLRWRSHKGVEGNARRCTAGLLCHLSNRRASVRLVRLVWADTVDMNFTTVGRRAVWGRSQRLYSSGLQVPSALGAIAVLHRLTPESASSRQLQMHFVLGLGI